VTTFNPRPPEKLPETYWLTRDRQRGVLSRDIEVWAGTPPVRLTFGDGDVVWLAADTDAFQDSVLLGTWPLPDAQAHVGDDVPHSDIVCVRIPSRAWPGRSLS
jgi:hypothetical protein